MSFGFNSIFGEPAKPPTGIWNIWERVKTAPKNIYGTIVKPFQILKLVVTVIILFFIYKRIK